MADSILPAVDNLLNDLGLEQEVFLIKWDNG